MPNDQHHHETIPAIDIQGVGFTYPSTGIGQGAVEALSGISMRIEPGARLGILGPNGGGKSTLIGLILGVLSPSTGAVRVFGQSPAQARKAGLIGYLPQRIEAKGDWPMSVRQVVGLPIACRGKPWKKFSDDSRAAVERAIELVGLSEQGDRAIGSLSGGELQRAMIARAIAGKPRLLVLDEPTVGVDVSGQHRFAELLVALHRELDLTTVIVTHDLRTIATVADRVACLSRTLHFHDDAEGLTPQVLADVFAHDVAAVFGDVHIDAHLADDCDDPSHSKGGCSGHDRGCDLGDCP
ncbi:MAG: metal ABC transporter ATP-binding protein [Phycisphaerales bacterium]|nr:metal ABC transporter ATP-binding protein [Phycisphaerales bacterium]